LREIRNLVKVFATLGVSKVRLTGGEPTVRGDIIAIAEAVAMVPGIRTVGISTNGYRLTDLAAPLKEAGVSAVNISVDSLDLARFSRITGRQGLEDVLEGVEAALRAGFASVKVNAVLLRGMNDEDVESFLEWVHGTPISMRFIELMRTGENEDFFERHHISAESLRLRLMRDGWRMEARGEDAGPAAEYSHPDYAGRIGIIAPYSIGFCSTCNRLRVSSRGELKLCLFGEGDYALRPLLQTEAHLDELVKMIETVIERKPASYLVRHGAHENTRNLAAIGG
jgi:cyclic pyranopterin phosphate synthase